MMADGPENPTSDSPSAAERGRRIFYRALLRAGMCVCALVSAMAATAAPARAWGCKGHQVVALLAEKHLTPNALAMAKKFLADGPIDPNLSRYCKEGREDPLADASTWPDDIRPFRPATAPWHYVDIPLGTTKREVEKYCPPKEGCVISAITDQLAVLRSANADPQKRAEALRFVIHFVGDMHQPLHGASNNDQGGNCVPVAFFDESPQLRNPQTENYAPNLHGVWDTNILERAMGMTVDQVAADLDHAFQKKIARWQTGAMDLDAWAWESYVLGAKKVYAKLPVPIPVEPSEPPITSCADSNHIAARMLKLNERIGDPYQNMAVAIVRQRLAQAGARLALVVNQLWP